MLNESRPNLTYRIRNSSYVFIPFFCNDNFDNDSINHIWRIKNQGNRYFLKYIVDKLTHDSSRVCCRPYLMDDEVRNKLGIVHSSRRCYLETRQYAMDGEPFSFYIGEILLFLFETNIGFLIYKIDHCKEDTHGIIASKNYHLKKIHTTLVYTEKDDGTKAALVLGTTAINSLSLLSEYILENTIGSKVEIFFNYAEKSERRSNILTHFNLKLEKKLSDTDNSTIEDILFHLKRNYHSEWEIEGASIYKDAEYFKASPYIRWGISSEATVCLTITDPETFFVGNSFYDNFHSYYLYEYVLALHQKYALYYFLTNFKAESDLDELEKNIAELANFRAKYVFQVISESETYQTVYSKQCKVFELESLFADINEQVNRVMQIKKVADEHKLEEQNDKINLILGLIAFLGVFSAIIDLNTLISWLEWILCQSQIMWVQAIATTTLILVSITFLSIFIRANWSKLKKKKRRKK